MANYAAGQTGVWTDPNTWNLIDSTSFANISSGNYNANTTITTTYQNTPTFTPGAITIDGIAIRIYGTNQTSPTGTITVALDQAGSDVSGTVVAINSTDLDYQENSKGTGHGWHFFKFAAPVTLIAATAYSVKIKSSVSNQLSVNNDNGGSTRFCKYLRTTTKSTSLTTGDNLFIAGELAGTNNPITVTVDNTATTIFGEISIGKRGTLFFNPAAFISYQLRLSSFMFVGSGATLQFGTLASPVPNSAAAIIEFVVTSNAQFGLEVLSLGIFLAYTESRLCKSTLSVANSAGNTVLTLSDLSVTNWQVGDTIAIASTTRTPSQNELRTISFIVGNQVTVSVALTNAHDIGAEVISIPRPIKIRGTVSFTAYVTIWSSYTNISGIEFSYLGSGTSTKRGVNIANIAISPTSVNTNSINISNCSFHDFQSSAYGIANERQFVPQISITIFNNVFYKIGQHGIFWNNGGAGLNDLIDNNVIIQSSDAGTGNNASGINLTDSSAVTVSNNVVAGNLSTQYAGISWSSGSSIDYIIFVNNTIHSCGKYGLDIGTAGNAPEWLNPSTYNGFKIYRNAGEGIVFLVGNSTNNNLTFIDTTLYGNTNRNVYFPNSVAGVVTFQNLNCSIDASFSTTTDVEISAYCPLVYIGDSTLTNLIFSATYSQLRLSNTTITTISTVGIGSVVSSDLHNKTTGSYLRVNDSFRAVRDTGIHNTDVASMRIFPNSSSAGTLNLFGSFKVAVTNGVTYTITLDVRRSLSGESATLGGNNAANWSGTIQPKLYARFQPSMGFYDDTVIATGSSSAGTWETLSGIVTPTDTGVLEFSIGVAGTFTVGWINVENFTGTSSVDPSIGEIVADGQQAALIDSNSSLTPSTLPAVVLARPRRMI